MVPKRKVLLPKGDAAEAYRLLMGKPKPAAPIRAGEPRPVPRQPRSRALPEDFAWPEGMGLDEALRLAAKQRDEREGVEPDEVGVEPDEVKPRGQPKG